MACILIRIDRQDFLDISRVICEVFPLEDPGTYFIPSQGSVPANGSLYSVYRTYRERLGAVGLAVLRYKRKIEMSSQSSEIAAEIHGITGDEAMQSLEFVKVHTDPKSEMLIHWERSREERLKLLAGASNMDYINNFPALQMGNGFEYFLLDFDSKYPDAPKILDVWPSFATKVMAFAKSYRNKSENLKSLLKDVDTAAHPMIMAIKVLPLILKITNKRKPKTSKSAATEKKIIRSSKPEVAVDFVKHFLGVVTK